LTLKVEIEIRDINYLGLNQQIISDPSDRIKDIIIGPTCFRLMPYKG